MSKSELKVLTYNVFHDLPLYRRLEQRLRLIAAEISAERPHVIALQEIARAARCGDAGATLCAMANESCGRQLYRLDYARADGSGEGEFAFEEGIALMSRLESEGAPEVLKFDAQVQIAAELAGHRYRLPDDRVAMLARYRLGDGIQLQACVTHLTDRSEAIDGVPVRLIQAGELVRWLQSVCDTRQPVLLAGDFNDVPDSQTLATITGAGFTDLWRAAGDGPGYTNDRSDIELESPHGSPNQRIDYLFFRPGAARDFEIAAVRLFLDRPRRTNDGGWLWGSDHVGVIATLGLRAP
jgi:endonuclease/exonuclease/phosphatase family metal-dependent hydrolase